MDTDSRYIIGLEIGDSREVKRVSQKLEKELVTRGLLQFVQFKTKLLIWEVVSDASRTIISLLSKYI